MVPKNDVVVLADVVDASPPRRRRAAAALLLTLLGCTSAVEPRAAFSPPRARAPLTPGPEPDARTLVAPAASRSRPEVPELARFHRALSELAGKRRKRHVRIYWIGDSHGQADFWSGALRSALAERFGSGGPGYVHLGYKNYRHDGLKLDIQGRWRMRPKKPVNTKREGDGVYGLGGLMMSGYADSPRVELLLTAPIPGERVTYDVCFRFHNPDDALSLRVEGGERRDDLAVSEATPAKVVHHAHISGPSAAPLVVVPRGRTDLCGVAVESDPTSHPGVVLDTLSLNGARFATALAWDGPAWIAEAARRPPDLVILELGTNEAGDGSPRYEAVAEDLGALLARARAAAPEVDCVVVSPTDRADAESRSAKMRGVLKESSARLGCFWFDAWEKLGGEGAMAKLREEPDPKVQPDGIHLTIKGYRELGATMYAELMAGYPWDEPL